MSPDNQPLWARISTSQCMRVLSRTYHCAISILSGIDIVRQLSHTHSQFGSPTARKLLFGPCRLIFGGCIYMVEVEEILQKILCLASSLYWSVLSIRYVWVRYTYNRWLKIDDGTTRRQDAKILSSSLLPLYAPVHRRQHTSADWNSSSYFLFSFPLFLCYNHLRSSSMFSLVPSLFYHTWSINSPHHASLQLEKIIYAAAHHEGLRSILGWYHCRDETP